MKSNISENSKVVNTTIEDFDNIICLFHQAIKLQGLKNYKVWEAIDEVALKEDIKNNLQYKIVNGNNILCLFSIQRNDPFIWRNKDKNNAIYLHRIVVNPMFKGQRQFEKVLKWSIELAIKEKKNFLRMDTWADNLQLIEYYKTFGFKFIENYKTKNTKKLPSQNRNLNVALLEYKINKSQKVDDISLINQF